MEPTSIPLELDPEVGSSVPVPVPDSGLSSVTSSPSSSLIVISCSFFSSSGMIVNEKVKLYEATL